MSGLQLDDLTMRYGRRTLFENVSAAISPGEILLVTGANGAGKSTLLKIIAGLIRPELGSVVFDGGRENLGYAAPDANLYAELTGRENLEFYARLRGVKNENFDALLKRVGLNPSRGRGRVGAYSSGMRQRLKLAAALLGNPTLLIWDEPTATLDADGEASALAILGQHGAAGGIAVVATNDAAETARRADGPRIHIGRQ